MQTHLLMPTTCNFESSANNTSAIVKDTLNIDKFRAESTRASRMRIFTKEKETLKHSYQPN